MRRKKRGKNQVFTVTLPKLAVCVCARACVCVSMCGHVFLKIFTFCFQRPTLFLEMALNTKSMKNAYSLFLRVPLFTFQTPEGPFLLLSGRHRRSGCLTGPREAGRRRRNQWGALGGVGFCCLHHSCWQVRPFCLMQSQQAWVSHTHTSIHIHTDAHTWRNSGFNQGSPWEREERALSHWRHWRWLAFLSGGTYRMYAHTDAHSHMPLQSHSTLFCPS